MSAMGMEFTSQGWRINPLVRLFTSIWFGVALLFIILAYSSVFSAFPQVRGVLEVTEMQAFQHWFFLIAVVLFVISLAAVTFVRSKWTWMNAGSVVTHIGLITLCLGCAWYFGRKIEGDVLLRSPEIILRSTAGGRPRELGTLLAEAQSSWGGVLPGQREVLKLVVAETGGTPNEPLTSARLAVQVGQNPPQAIDLRANGAWTPITDSVDAALLTHQRQTKFYDRENAALYFLAPDADDFVIKPLETLPIHRERYTQADPNDAPLRDKVGTEMPSKRVSPALNLFGLSIPTGWFERWRMPIDVDSGELPFDVRITGYAPYTSRLSALTDETGRALLNEDGQVRRELIVEPIHSRLPSIGARTMSAIRLELRGRGEHAGWTRTQWMLFSQYPDTESRPLQITPPGGGAPWTIIYSRERHDLGFTLIPRKLTVTYFPGKRGVESWRSDYYVQAARGEPARADLVYTNQTSTVGDWTLYQSGAAQDGWSYTILGVGNRFGILPMFIGWIVVTIGCLYAFYVKPILLRRMQARWSDAA